jgi:hypothetical protein
MNTDIVYIEGLGYCREITVNSYNAYGINEPHTIYEPIKK